MNSLTRVWHFALGLLVAMASVVVFAEGVATTEIDRLLEQSGVSHTLREIEPGMVQSMQQTGVSLPAALGNAMVLSAHQAFQAEPMIATAREQLQQKLDGAQVQAALQWLDSPLGQRITALENRSAGTAVQTEMEQFREGLKKSGAKIGERRMAQLGELDRLTGATDMALKLVEATALAGVSGVNAAMPPQVRMSGEALKKLASDAVQEERERMPAIVQNTMVFTYHTLSDDELERYLSFLRSSDGQVYAREVGEAVQKSMMDALGRFVGLLQATLKGAGSARGI